MQVERTFNFYKLWFLKIKLLVADGWVTRKNLPLGGGQQLETVANTPYAEEQKDFYLPKDGLASD